MAEDIVVRIPPELTAAMIIRAGVITNETRALELATELHEVVSQCVALWISSERKPGPLEIADFSLAVWRQAIRNGRGDAPDGPDQAEAAWISETLAELCDNDSFLRWLMLGDVITGRDAASLLRNGDVQ
jgi:hypothetical protein